MSSFSSLSLTIEKSNAEIERNSGPAELQLHVDKDTLPQAPEDVEEKPQSSDPFLVKWEPQDPKNPRNWPTPYKAWITFQLSMLALTASLGSSIVAPAQPVIAEYLGVSEETTILVVSLYVLGFAVGPIFWAPISEVRGRRWSLLPATLGLALFSIGTATSNNAQSIFITRFFAGMFGSAPVSNVGASLGDIWCAKSRGTAVAFFAVAVVGGPTIGPTIGAALTVNKHLGWRWTE